MVILLVKVKWDPFPLFTREGDRVETDSTPGGARRYERLVVLDAAAVAVARAGG
jgi:hypothetical protein